MNGVMGREYEERLIRHDPSTILRFLKGKKLLYSEGEKKKRGQGDGESSNWREAHLP